MSRTPNPYNPKEMRHALQSIQFDTAILSSGSTGSVLIGAGAGNSPTWSTSLTALTLLTVDNITINGAAITSSSGAISFDNENISTTGTITGVNVTSGADPGHTHTGSSLSGIDISDDTNLAATSPIVLTGDTLSLNQGAVDHGSIGGLGDDDHTQYILVSGTRAFSGVVGGVTPVANSDLATKGYVDTAIAGSMTKYPFTAQVDIYAGKPVYVSSEGYVDIAYADDPSAKEVVGLTLTSVSATESVDVVPDGYIELANWNLVVGTPTLVPGALYYLDVEQTPEAASYSNTGGSGDRLLIITVTTTVSLHPTYSQDITEIVDGITGSSTLKFTLADCTNRYIRFDFGEGASKVIEEAIWYQSTGGVGYNHGTWRFQGSNNGTSWTNIGSTFTLGSSAPQTLTELAGNTTGYRYYQLFCTTGTASSNPNIKEIEFKIKNYEGNSFGWLTSTKPTTSTVIKIGRAISTTILDVEIEEIPNHAGLNDLGADDHTQYHNDSRAATWLAANHETTYNHSNYNAAYSHKTTEDAINGLVKCDGAGSYSAVTDNSSNWNTAYGWGNHGAAGYALTTNVVPYTGASSDVNLGSHAFTTTGTLGAGAITGTSITDSGMTIGSVLFAGTGGLVSQDNANFFWDATDKQLSIGPVQGTRRLNISGDTANDGMQVDYGIDLNPVAMPSSLGLALHAGAELSVALYYYSVQYITDLGLTNLYPIDLASFGQSINVTAGNQEVTITVPVSSDYRVTGRKIWRTGPSMGYVRYLVTTINDNTTTTYLDNNTDAALMAGTAFVGYSQNTTAKPLTINGLNSFSLQYANTILGLEAGPNLTVSAGRDVLIGARAGYALTSGTENILIGQLAGSGLTTEGANVGIGGSSCQNALNANVGIGYITARGGQRNIGIGYGALASTNASSTSNISLGVLSATYLSSGSYNVFIGSQSGQGITTGSSNVFIGYRTGVHQTTNSNLLIIDNDVRGTAGAPADQTYSIVYGVMASAPASQTLRFNASVGIRCDPSAYLTLPAGTTAAATAPLKFTSGTSLTAPEAGAVEFTTDDLYFTITTGAARKGFIFNDGTNLTASRVPYATTNGRLTDSANLTFDGTNLTCGGTGQFTKTLVPEVKTDTSAPADLTITTGAAKTLVLATSVYDDVQFSVNSGKVPAANAPNWETFTANTSAYAFSVDDYIDLQCNELPHGWKEGTAGHAHLHFTIKTAQSTGADRFAKFSVWVAYADTNEAWIEQAVLSTEATIPTGSAALTHFYLDLGDLTLTNYLVGAQLVARVKRIAATGGTEYADDVYITQVGVHVEKVRVGSRSETTS